MRGRVGHCVADYLPDLDAAGLVHEQHLFRKGDRVSQPVQCLLLCLEESKLRCGKLLVIPGLRDGALMSHHGPSGMKYNVRLGF